MLKVFTHAIGIIRLARGYVTLKDVHEFIQAMNYDRRDENAITPKKAAASAVAFLVRRRVLVLPYLTSSSPTPP